MHLSRNNALTIEINIVTYIIQNKYKYLSVKVKSGHLLSFLLSVETTNHLCMFQKRKKKKLPLNKQFLLF